MGLCFTFLLCFLQYAASYCWSFKEKAGYKYWMLGFLISASHPGRFLACQANHDPTFPLVLTGTPQTTAYSLKVASLHERKDGLVVSAVDLKQGGQVSIPRPASPRREPGSVSISLSPSTWVGSRAGLAERVAWKWERARVSGRPRRGAAGPA